MNHGMNPDSKKPLTNSKVPMKGGTKMKERWSVRHLWLRAYEVVSYPRPSTPLLPPATDGRDNDCGTPLESGLWLCISKILWYHWYVCLCVMEAGDNDDDEDDNVEALGPLRL
ncbi:hypothetical protein V9T40_006107 [Parthenolecanium corni]|uniref:Uncharacterized protein n=1 Tax=Parthenolecanium corni TaxID=536013 RepID=A0AAN9TXE5_9HEMI